MKFLRIIPFVFIFIGMQAYMNLSYAGSKNANEYKQKRELEYPELEDQLDDIYHNGIEGWKTKIKTIKEKYPKP